MPPLSGATRAVAFYNRVFAALAAWNPSMNALIPRYRLRTMLLAVGMTAAGCAVLANFSDRGYRTAARRLEQEAWNDGERHAWLGLLASEYRRRPDLLKQLGFIESVYRDGRTF